MSNNTGIKMEEVFQEIDEICPVCGSNNSYSWDDCNQPGTEDFDPDFEVIYHIPVASCTDWQCGKCGLSFADANSVYTANVFTHCDE